MSPVIQCTNAEVTLTQFITSSTIVPCFQVTLLLLLLLPLLLRVIGRHLVKSILSLPVTLMSSIHASACHLGALFLAFVFWTILHMVWTAFLSYPSDNVLLSPLPSVSLRILSCNVVPFIVHRIFICVVLIWSDTFRLLPQRRGVGHYRFDADLINSCVAFYSHILVLPNYISYVLWYSYHFSDLVVHFTHCIAAPWYLYPQVIGSHHLVHDILAHYSLSRNWIFGYYHSLCFFRSKFAKLNLCAVKLNL